MAEALDITQADIKQMLHDHITELLPLYYTETDANGAQIQVSVTKHGSLALADLPGIAITFQSDAEARSALGDVIDSGDLADPETLAEGVTDSSFAEVIGAGFEQRVEVRIISVNGDQRDAIRIALKPVLLLAREAFLTQGQFEQFRLVGGGDEIRVQGPNMFYEYPYTVTVQTPTELFRPRTAIEDVAVTPTSSPADDPSVGSVFVEAGLNT